MPISVYHDRDVKDVLIAAACSHTRNVGGKAIRRPFPSPADWRDHWIYFLMVDRLNNPERPPLHPWDIATGERQGGTLEGVRQKLRYIKDLGAGAIWLTPVLKNRLSEASHHGYAIEDFLSVDPRLGTDDDLIRLVDEAHALGLYVIMDVVINHAADLFAYRTEHGQLSSSVGWSPKPLQVAWRDASGAARIDCPDAASPPPGMTLQLNPLEMQTNAFFRCQGMYGPNEQEGDFVTLKEFKTDQMDSFRDKPVANVLIRSYQHAVAKYDVDGFRIDTIKYVERDCALTFCNAIREFAVSIGKASFFFFGEVADNEGKIAEYVGRNTADPEDRVGADAALDFPTSWTLSKVIKGPDSPLAMRSVFETRRTAQRGILSSHGEASRYFVTFCDNHDGQQRFYCPRSGTGYERQVPMVLASLFGIQGIPCIYYGTELGLKGTQDIYRNRDGRPENVREAMWGAPNAFDQNHPWYREIQRMSEVRAREPALRYGRQYFREVSGNNVDFGLSTLGGGILAFSRILNDREVVVIANTNTQQAFHGWVLVDDRINTASTAFKIEYSNLGATGNAPVTCGDVTFHAVDGGVTRAWALRAQVHLEPMEIQILAP